MQDWCITIVDERQKMYTSRSDENMNTIEHQTPNWIIAALTRTSAVPNQLSVAPNQPWVLHQIEWVLLQIKQILLESNECCTEIE